MSRKKGKYITIGLMILGVLILIIGIFLMTINSLFGFLIMIGFILFIISFLAFGVRYNPNGCWGSQEEFFDEESFNETIIEYDNKNSTIITTVYKYREIQSSENTTCMISKISLDGKLDVLQCVFCKSVFMGEYLREWIEEHDTCPVCKEKLKITLEKKRLG